MLAGVFVLILIITFYSGDLSGAMPAFTLLLGGVLVLGGIVIGSLLLQRSGGSPITWAIGLVAQSAVSIFVLLYLKPPR